MSNYNPIALIPHYNHAATVGDVARQLLSMDLPVLIVDDGSDVKNLTNLKYLEQWDGVSIVYCAQNGGKGTAVKIGFAEALKRGFTHVIQVDADGQHNISDTQRFIEKSRENPTALICGNPVYGSDAPKARLYGRKITDFWNAVNTLSFDLLDGMCGFRLYPLETAIEVINEEKIGDRMDFDTEILVRMHWRKIPMIWINTQVKYKSGGVSHFRGLADNWLISKMHARLFIGMLKRVLAGKKV
jgi:glycosyltransferase, group 2 family